MFEEIKAIQKTNEHTAEFINALMDSGEFENENEAFVLLRATLKALRDRIDPHEAMHLGAQLPALLRGFYIEGYDFSQMDRPKSLSKDVSEFLGEVKKYLAGYDQLKLDTVVPEAMNVIFDFIDEGEVDHVLTHLPKEVQDFCH
ncbi:MAG: DUF2267 domain-containing protein [Bacteriovoracia bacterium]